jgi:hypothetical protein
LRGLAGFREPAENLLCAVTGEHQAQKQTHDAVNRISETIQRVHVRRLFPALLCVKILLLSEDVEALVPGA